MLKKNRLYFKLKGILTFILLALFFDFIYTNINKNLFSFDFENLNSNIHGNFKNGIKEYYISPIYGKTLFCTDQNGFRNNCKKTDEKKFDFLLIGNIFTEGVYTKHEQTFVGIIEENNKKYKFANLGNRSLDIYGIEKKIIDIIENDYVNFNEVIIFIGPRFFQEKKGKKKINNFSSTTSLKRIIMNNFYLFNNFYHWILYKTNKTKIWAYSKSNHYTKEINVNKNFLEALNNINKKLEDDNKKMSIVMYPYPYHLLYKNYNSEFIKIIENFCHKNCNLFINTFEVFHSKLINKDPWELISDFYLSYSVHFNYEGNKIIADTVSKYLK